MTTDSPIRTAPIVQTSDGFFRRVDHAAKLASIGFTTAEAMVKNTDILRVDSAATETQRRRYIEIFGGSN